MILKLQRPLQSNDPAGFSEILAYNEDRSFQTTIPCSLEQQQELFGNAPKIYVEAHVENQHVVVDALVDPQPW